jgi:putative aminopeptidase FrvX
MIDANSLKFFQELCNSHGPSGFEREATALMKAYVQNFADKVYNDRIGSLVFEKKGKEDSPVILVPGHIDEVGFVVTDIADSGFLKFSNLGGWFDQILLGQRVRIATRKGMIQGVISAKPPHLLGKDEREKVIPMEKMFIDIGAANKREATEMGVRIGDSASPVAEFWTSVKKKFEEEKEVGETTLAFGKAFDDRVGVFLAGLLIKQLKEEGIEHPNKVVGAATVQEEVGLRGARTVANLVKPDVALVLEVDIAGDVPGIEPGQAPAKMGRGVAITTFDKSMIPNQPLKELAIELCERNDIPYQLSQVSGGTDAGVIHISNVGCPSLVLGAPTRHIHSNLSIIDISDLEAMLRLLKEMVKALDKKTVEALVEL